MTKLESLVKRYEFLKKMWLNSAGTSEQSQWEAQLEQIINEMNTYQKSHGIDARTTPAEKVMAMYALYTETPENASKRKED